MKTGKMTISIIFSILVLVVAQVLAQLLGSVLVLVKIPAFIANMAARHFIHYNRLFLIKTSM